ncbi:MAG: TIGR00730 family Rossman fold protein [Rhodospirillales bacterium]|nr:TIGR00730 family Rossman fold protein [Rhodospirillales bacterium]
MQAILANPGYLPADQDVEFLRRNDTRGVRLQLDYQKAELLLEGHGVAHTIVVFGSTRITERRAAQRLVETAAAALAAAPDDPARRHRLEAAERLLANSRYYDLARQFGALVAADSGRAHGGPMLVVTGGGPGIMEAANRGAHDTGGRSIGLNITLPHEQYPNPYVTPSLCFQFHYFAIRKLHFLRRARALVIFPGGYGTLDEFFEVMALVQTRKMRPLPVVLVGEAFWRRALDVDFLVEQGTIDPEDRDLFWYAETAEEIWGGIQRWYEMTGTPLLRAATEGTP